MRILVPACLSLVAVSCIASGVMWFQLRSDRQHISDLQAQLTEARAALAGRPAVVAVPAAAEAVSGITNPEQSSVAPSAPPATITREQALAALSADEVKRQKALMADAGFREASIARARAELKARYSALAVELGLSDSEMDKVLDLLAGGQARMMDSMAQLSEGAATDPAAQAELRRLVEQQQRQLKDQMTALLGPQRYAQFEEYDHIQPSRTRVNNLSNLLARSGQAMTNPQIRSLTAVMVAEQKRREAETQAMRDAGRTETRSAAELQEDTNRRILERLPGFLSGAQVELVRGRFEQRATIDRASDQLQQRERQVLQESPN